MDQVINMLSEYGFYFALPIAFLAVVLWIYRPSAKKRYQADGKIPFYGDNKSERSW